MEGNRLAKPTNWNSMFVLNLPALHVDWISSSWTENNHTHTSLNSPIPWKKNPKPRMTQTIQPLHESRVLSTLMCPFPLRYRVVKQQTYRTSSRHESPSTGSNLNGIEGHLDRTLAHPHDSPWGHFILKKKKSHIRSCGLGEVIFGFKFVVTFPISARVRCVRMVLSF